MENSTTIKYQLYVCYGIALLAAISLCFTGKYETSFASWLHGDPADSLSPLFANFTLNKISLSILDFSLFLIVASPLPVEDERVEKIRAFAMRQAFILGLIGAAFFGLVIPGKFNPLIYVLIIECYYLSAFRLYLYRDSRVIYLTVAEQQANAAANKKRFIIFGIVQGGIGGLLLGAADNHHWLNLYWIIITIYIGIWALGAIIYSSWKS